MTTVTVDELRTIILPQPGSHKGQNGRLLIIGGSHLFHAASLWSLEVASRIVDLVHYSSVPENNEIVLMAKKQFRNGIVVSRNDIEAYIAEDDCILIGPGMTRDHETEELTNRLLKQYPHKQWVLDAGALQMMDISLIPKHAILTPHHGEFGILWKKSALGDSSFARSVKVQTTSSPLSPRAKAVTDLENTRLPALSESENVTQFAKTHQCIVLLKGQKDIASDGKVVRVIEGGNEGMTKGGTGDVLAGLIAAFACKNDPLLATIAGSFINKNAGDELYKTVGPFFNASDLASQIPITLKTLLM